MSSRQRLRPRAALAPHDKAVPNLFGIPVPVVSAAKQRVGLQRNAPYEGDTAGRFDAARAAFRSHLDTLKHVAAGIAISAALFTGTFKEIQSQNQHWPPADALCLSRSHCLVTSLCAQASACLKRDVLDCVAVANVPVML